MLSSRTAAMNMRRGVGVVGVTVSALVVTALMLVLATSAQAHHRPPHITVNPQPAVPVPDTVTTTASGLDALRFALPAVLPDAPDLIPIMPEVTALNHNVPALFVDTVEIPGLTLYRFDAVLANVGGAFDLYCQSCSGPVQTLWQAIWPGGRPPGPQSGFTAPVGTTDTNLSARGATMLYAPASGHNHWHYDVAASYEFLIPGAPSIPTVKIGFCMLDTYDTLAGPNYYGGGQPWCMAGNIGASFVQARLRRLSPWARFPGRQSRPRYRARSSGRTSSRAAPAAPHTRSTRSAATRTPLATWRSRSPLASCFPPTEPSLHSRRRPTRRQPSPIPRTRASSASTRSRTRRPTPAV